MVKQATQLVAEQSDTLGPREETKKGWLRKKPKPQGDICSSPSSGTTPWFSPNGF